ncbi:endonuclease/exonuclease/phosphatase family protein [Amycolatopsis sp. NPDC004079]|uniref:endonuclease/exonuclease/phosphatase family protein n=1 Tax=Amycolatopsis sp. NPDC004079 TaxID=3154549 RepID=UPI0033B1BDEC
MVTLMSVNALNLYGSEAPDEQKRFRGLEALIRARNPDVLAVQEIISTGEAEAAAAGRMFPVLPTTQDKTPGAIAGLRRLGEATGLNWQVGGLPAIAVGGIIHHTALLWRDGIEPVPGTLHPLMREGAGMWHCAIAGVFDFGGPKARVGSVQLSPFDQQWAARDANQLIRAFHRDDIPGFLGGDFNGIGAQKIVVGDGCEWYDRDPYVYGGKFGVQEHPDHAYQFDENGALDRRAAARLEHPKIGRMRDCAVVTGSPWEPTTGHFSKDMHPDRRVDRWYATHRVPTAAVTGFRVVPVDEVTVTLDGERVELTDHRPIEVDVAESELVG